MTEEYLNKASDYASGARQKEISERARKGLKALTTTQYKDMYTYFREGFIAGCNYIENKDD